MLQNRLGAKSISGVRKHFESQISSKNRFFVNTCVKGKAVLAKLGENHR